MDQGQRFSRKSDLGAYSNRNRRSRPGYLRHPACPNHHCHLRRQPRGPVRDVQPPKLLSHSHYPLQGHIKFVKTEDLLAMTVDDCLAHLRSSSSGLSTGEAALRQKRYGMNEIAEASRYRGLAAFLGHLKNPLVIILLIAAIISAFVGEIVQAIIILVIVVLSVTLDFFQEYRAEAAVDLLRQKISRTATAFRDGERREIRMAELVPGDVIDHGAGNPQTPACLRAE